MAELTITEQQGKTIKTKTPEDWERYVKEISNNDYRISSFTSHFYPDGEAIHYVVLERSVTVYN